MQKQRKLIITTRIIHPWPLEIFPRKRLFQALTKARNYPVIWVIGPPGSGKTSLASSYIHNKKIPCIWHAVDGRDDDLSTFFNSMSMAVKKTFSTRQKPLPRLTRKYAKNISAFSKYYFEDIYHRIKPPFLIVFDDYQNISETSDFHTVIGQGLDKVPDGINIIVLSRKEPPGAFIRLRAHHRICFFDRDGIYFTQEETAKIVRRKAKRKLNNEAVQQIQGKTKGWAAGVLLMLERTGTKNIDYQFMDKQTPRGIFNYFENEIFLQTDRKTRKFLLNTAFLPEMTAEMAQELTDIKFSEQILSHLHRNNYFIEKHSSAKSVVYQYHPLFREFLLFKATNAFTQSELLHIRQRAAALLEASGQIEYAAGLLHAAKDWRGLSRLVRTHIQSLIAHQDDTIIAKLVSDIPEDVMERNPWFLYLSGISRFTLPPEESKAYFKRAFLLFNKRNDMVGALLACSGVIDSILLKRDNYTHLDEWTRWLNKCIRKKYSFPSRGMEIRIVSSMIGSLTMRQPHSPRLGFWIEKADALAEDTTVNINDRVVLGYHLLNYYLLSGCYVQAASLMRFLKSPITPKSLSALPHIMWRCMEASFSYFVLASPDASLKAVKKGLEISRHTEVNILDSLLIFYGGLSGLLLKNMNIAQRFLGKMASFTHTSSIADLSNYFYLCAYVDLYKTDCHGALHNSQKALQCALKSGMPFLVFVNQIGIAEILFTLGQQKKAANQFSNALHTIQNLRNNAINFIISVFEAQFAFKRGNESKGTQALHRALSLGKEAGMVNIAGWHSSSLLRFCTKAIEKGIEAEYVHGIVQKHQLMPDNSLSNIEHWPWYLKIYTLGQFLILKNGKPIESSRKVQQKPLMLLKALITLGGKEIKEEQLTDLLWPDSEGDAAHSAFTTNLARLRQLIANKDIIRVKEGMVSLNPCYCWVDTWAFEKIMDQIDTQWEDAKIHKDISQIIVLSQKIFHIYKGRFLASDVKYSWTFSLRERLKARFLRFIIKLSQYWEQEGNYEKAEECYYKGLDLDDMTEELYQGLMTYYHRSNQKSKAIAVYLRCRNTLSAVLNINPSSKTEAIYQQIIMS